jgi:hypothetical protein
MIGMLLCNFVGSVLPRSAGAPSIARLLVLSAIPVGLAALGWILKNRGAD